MVKTVPVLQLINCHIKLRNLTCKREFPILTTKFVAFKTAVKELLWIWQNAVNDVRKLQEMNVRVWDEWMREDGTIGKGLWLLQIAKYKQLDISSRLSRKILIAVV